MSENFYWNILNKKQPGSQSIIGEDYITPTPVVAPVNTTNDNFVVTGSKPLLEPVVSRNFLTQTAAPKPDLATTARTALPTEMTTPAQNQVVKSAAPPEFPSPAKTPYEQYWGQNVGTSKAGLPLDQFVKIAGLAAKYFDPQNPIANDLIRMGGEAYNERARREYEGPNVLLQRQLAQEQIRKAKEDMPKEWDIFIKANRLKGIPDEESVKQFMELKRDKRFAPVITRDNQGNVYSVDRNDGTYTLIGNIGQNVTEQVKGAAVGASGDVTTYGKTGKKISVLPGAGKPMVAPGAAGAAADARKQAQKESEGKKFVSVWTNPTTKQQIHITEGTTNNPPEYWTNSTTGWRKATQEEITGLVKPGTERQAKGSSNPFARSSESKGPAVGTVSKGYRFKGGDPKLQANWEKI